MTISRRGFLRLVGAGAGALATSPALRAVAAETRGAGEFFLFIHAAGGWDVTLWADPRNEKKGIVDPASSENTDTSQLRHWQDVTLEGGARTFKPLVAAGGRMVFGPGIGNLFDFADRICLLNGLAMNTVSHPDGTTFSATGRHLQGGHVVQASINTAIANELGTGQIFPSVSVQFPSSFVGDLDRRAMPLGVERIGGVARTLARPKLYTADEDRAAATALVAREADALADASEYPGEARGVRLQLGSLERMLDGGQDGLGDVFAENKLRAAHPAFNYRARFHGPDAVNAAFAVEAMRRDIVRSVAFSLGGFDTHGSNYRFQALVQQDLFDMLATLVRTLDETPHPTRHGSKLSDATHILVFSDFCRTPQINLGGGRDHYPNNSALVISPRFRGGQVFGRTDEEQLLPADARRFSDGERPISPPDMLATFLTAFGIEPRKYLRDGEAIPELLRA